MKVTPMKDSLIWKVTSSGSYTMKACYLHLEGGVSHVMPVKMLCKPCVSTEVGFFAWEVWWGKMLTTEQLKRRVINSLANVPSVVMLKNPWNTS